MKAKAIQLLWLHIAQRNDSILGDYLSTFEKNVLIYTADSMTIFSWS